MSTAIEETFSFCLFPFLGNFQLFLQIKTNKAHYPTHLIGIIENLGLVFEYKCQIKISYIKIIFAYFSFVIYPSLTNFTCRSDLSPIEVTFHLLLLCFNITSYSLIVPCIINVSFLIVLLFYSSAVHNLDNKVINITEHQLYSFQECPVWIQNMSRAGANHYTPDSFTFLKFQIVYFICLFKLNMSAFLVLSNSYILFIITFLKMIWLLLIISRFTFLQLLFITF